MRYRDAVAAPVDREEKATIRGKLRGALRAKRCSGARTSYRDRRAGERGEGTVDVARERDDGVTAGGVTIHVEVAANLRLPFWLCRRRGPR